jgi:predicted kinase
MKKIIFVVGLPGVGKSSVIANKFPNATVISNDAVVQAYADKHNITYNEAYKLVPWEEVTKTCRTQFDAAVARKDSIIVIDNTHMTKKSRARYQAKGYERHCIIVTCDEDERVRRNSLRVGKVIPDKAIEEMKRFYQEPSSDEGFVTIETFDNTKKIYWTHEFQKELENV